MTPAGVFFDLDGTLIDSVDDLTAAVNHMRSRYEMPPLDRLEVRAMVGKGAVHLVKQALKTDDPQMVEAGLAAFIDYNTGHIADHTVLYPGVSEMLQALTARGLKLALISNKMESLTRLILDRLLIGRFFEIICGGDTFPQMKPSPLPLLEVCRKLGLHPGQAVMVGDSINDIQAGKSAGIPTIGCDWGYGYGDEVIQADAVVSSCRDLGRLLLNHREAP